MVYAFIEEGKKIDFILFADKDVQESLELCWGLLSISFRLNLAKMYPWGLNCLIPREKDKKEYSQSLKALIYNW